MMNHVPKSRGVPIRAISLGLTGFVLLLGGLSIVFGICHFFGNILLGAFLIQATLMMHNFCRIDDPQMKMADKINFMNNTALLGAMRMFLDIPQPWCLRPVL